MRTIKLVVLGVLAVILVLLGVSNTTAVDLHLLPPALGEGYSLTGVPLAMVIAAALLLGILLGLAMEFVRERKHRSAAGDGRREIAELRAEVTRLRRRLDDETGSLPRLPAG
jgi:uncharacterized integral membrane protein